ncbi:SEL1-like repeat protein [Sulfurovum sp. XGS-02]|uniref:SEL1-like repeat protein n=1 Tax=Sulfurovum sp. XGS-02 TaxID=2925411 RepID=UPI002045F7A1|nr:SEL1-like repeat protein [Sulfurovum sp. XGS-02]UPT76831.1 SEL1-like repeat protein [Sulfurovum sp. XGS-02]
MLEYLNDLENVELYILLALFLFTIWFILNTVKYYKGEKRKVRHLHRFAKEGEAEAQHSLAERYRKGYLVKKSCKKAAFWYQKAAFSGDENAKSFLEKLREKKHCS